MKQARNFDDPDHVYISCLTYLAAEAERDENYVVADILKSATADIFRWKKNGDQKDAPDPDELIESLTSAFMLLLMHTALPDDKKNKMLAVLSSLGRARLN